MAPVLHMRGYFYHQPAIWIYPRRFSQTVVLVVCRHTCTRSTGYHHPQISRFGTDLDFSAISVGQFFSWAVCRAQNLWLETIPAEKQGLRFSQTEDLKIMDFGKSMSRFAAQIEVFRFRKFRNHGLWKVRVPGWRPSDLAVTIISSPVPTNLKINWHLPRYVFTRGC